MTETVDQVTGPTAYPLPDRVRGRETTAFHTTVLIAGAGFGITAPFTAVLVVVLGGGETAAALIVSSMGATLLLVDLFGSAVLPRLGSRWILCAAPLIFGAGSLVSVAFGPWQLVGVGRMVQGLGTAIFMSGGVHLAVRLGRSGRRGAAIGSFNAAWFAGIAVGPLGGGLLALLAPGAAGLRLLFVVAAVITLVTALVGWRIAPHTLSTGGARPGLPRRSGLRGRRAWSVLVLAGLGQTVRAGLAMTLVPLVGLAAGMGTLAIGGALFALAVTDIGSMAIGSRWADRHGRRSLLVAALGLGAALAVVLAITPTHPWVLAVVALGLGVTVGCSWTLPAAMAVDLGPDPEAAIGAYRIASDLGMLLGGGAVALVLALGTLETALLGAAVALVAAAVLAATVGETRRPLLPAGAP